jgi:hypothetical protein
MTREIPVVKATIPDIEKLLPEPNCNPARLTLDDVFEPIGEGDVEA